MSPRSADDKKSATKKNTASEGEITIDHGEKKQKVAEPVKADTAPLPTEKAKPDPEPSVQVPEPPKVSIQPLEHEQKTESKQSVVVPGGVTSSAPNPANYFTSKYRGRAKSGSIASVPMTSGTGGLPQQQVAQSFPNPAAMQQSIQNMNPARKKLIAYGGVIGLVILLTVGYVFGVYLPSKPENVYATGMNRSGDALTAFVETLTDEDNVEKLTKAEVQGSFEAKIGAETLNGNISGNINKNEMELNAQATSTVSGGDPQNYELTLARKAPSAQDAPNTYFKASGVDLLGLESIVPGINNYNNKWIAIDGDYATSVNNSYNELIAGLFTAGTGSRGSGSESSIVKLAERGDLAEIAGIYASVSSKYIYTEASETSVYSVKEYVGKEEIDDVKTYHYTLAINAPNYLEYCKELGTEIINSQAYKKLMNSDEDSTAADLETNNAVCQEDAEAIAETDTVDVWIDSKYKLVYKFRFSTVNTPDTYYEVGQKYRGKDKLQFFVTTKDSETGTTLSIALNANFKSGESQLLVQYSADNESGDPSTITLNLSGKPASGNISVTQPEESVPLQDVAANLKLDLDSVLTPSTGLVPTNDIY